MSVLGDRIKKERENLGLTRDELANKIGVSYSAIAMYEQGNREPNNALMLKMCELFNCSIDYLMGKSNYRTLDLLKDDAYQTLNNIYYNLYFERLLKLGISNEDAHDMLKLFFYNFKNKNKEKEEIETFSKVINKYSDVIQEKICNITHDIANNFNDIFSTKEIFKKQNQNIESNVIPMPDTPVKVPIVGKISAGIPILAIENIVDYAFAPASQIKEGFEYFYLYVEGDSMNLKFNEQDLILVQQQDYLENKEIGVFLIEEEATVKQFREQKGNILILDPMSSNPINHTQMYDIKETTVKIIGKVISYQGKI